MDDTLEVTFGKRWEGRATLERLGLSGWWLESDGLYLVVQLNLRAVIRSHKATSICQARWRADGAIYHTVQTSVPAGEQVFIIWARRESNEDSD